MILHKKKPTVNTLLIENNLCENGLKGRFLQYRCIYCPNNFIKHEISAVNIINPFTIYYLREQFANNFAPFYEEKKNKKQTDVKRRVNSNISKTTNIF